MSGLDKIAAGIKQAAQEKANEIIAQAKERTQSILAAAAQVQDRRKAQCEEDAKREEKQTADRFDSENRQQRKQALLSARSQVIADIVVEAQAKVEALPDAEYFNLLRGVCVQNAQAGEGKLYFAKKDFDRLPSDFAETCNQEIQNGSVTLAGNVDSIRNGFVIVYGKIEQNCSIDSIFESRKNEILDVVNACLSAQG